MKSMTGFGSGTATKDGITCTVEIKSVNARFLDLFIRSPKLFLFRMQGKDLKLLQ